MFAKSQSLIVILVLTSLSTGDVRTAEAQGILQRLGDRIRERVVMPLPPVRPPVAPTDAPSRYNPNSGNPNLPNRTTQPQPRVVPPVAPDGLTKREQIPGSIDSDTSRYGGPTPLPRDGRSAEAIASQSKNDFGSSILAPMDDPAASSGNLPKVAKSGNASGDNLPRTDENRATIGIRVLDPRPGIPAVLVVDFHDGSMADDAGMRKGDTILSIDGVVTPSIEAIAAQLSNRTPGEVVRVQIGRQNQTMMLPIELVSVSSHKPVPNVPHQDDASRATAAAASELKVPQPSPTELPIQPSAASPEIEPPPTVAAARPTLGIDVEEPQGSRGAAVVAVEPGSPADLFGIKVGDRIVAVDHRFVVDTNRLEENMMDRKDPLAPMPVKLVRDDELVDLVIHFDGTEAARDAKSSSEVADSGHSILGGLGSKLGGLLGGKSTPSNDKDTQALSPSKMDSEDLPLPKPMPLAEPNPMSANSKVVTANATDALEFGDREPINHVIFEDSASAATRSSGMPPGDEQVLSEKPTLAKEAVEPRPQASTDASRDEVLSELRAEIERLQRRLESLEKAKKE